MLKELAGRSALLTGASGGLAPFIARRLAAEGVSLVVSARNREALDQLAAEIPGTRVVAADLSVAADVDRLAQESADVDIFVSNAGVLAAGRIDTVDAANIDATLDVNLRAPMVLAQRLATRMIARGSGHLVFVASIAGKIASPDYPVYTATKFGLRGFALALRQDLKERGIGVSLVSPTFVAEAGMWAITGEKAPMLAGETRPEDVADAVVKAIRTNRLELNVMPLTTHISSRLAGALPELTSEVARITRQSSVPSDAVARQRAKEGIK